MVNIKRTREDILSAVLDLVHLQGFQATGLKDLLAESGTSSGSFYNYFDSKNELAHALIDFQWQQIQEKVIGPALASSTDPIAQVKNMINRLEAKHLAEADCAGCFLGNLIVELPKQDPSFQTHLMEVFGAWQGQIANCLKQGQEQLRPGIRPDELAEQLLTLIEGVLLLSRLYNQPERLRRQFASVHQLLDAAYAPSEFRPYDTSHPPGKTNQTLGH